jgi:hypothetical protein
MLQGELNDTLCYNMCQCHTEARGFSTDTPNSP